MSPATVATIIINPPQIANKFHKFLAHKKTPPHFCKFNNFNRKLVKLQRSMTSGSSIESGDEYAAFEQEVNLIQNGGGVTFHQTLAGLHALANHLVRLFFFS